MGHGPLLSKSYWLAQLADDDNRLCPKKAAWATSKILRSDQQINKTGIGNDHCSQCPKQVQLLKYMVNSAPNNINSINSHHQRCPKWMCHRLGPIRDMSQAVFLPKCLGAWNLHRCQRSSGIMIFQFFHVCLGEIKRSKCCKMILGYFGAVQAVQAVHAFPVSAEKMHPIARWWILGMVWDVYMFLWPYNASKRRLTSPTTNGTLW